MSCYEHSTNTHSFYSRNRIGSSQGLGKQDRPECDELSNLDRRGMKLPITRSITGVKSEVGARSLARR